MKRVYTAGDLTLATLFVHFLEQHLIRAKVFNEHMFAVRLEVPYEAALPQVWVERDHDYARAKELAAEFELQRKQDASQPDRACGSCHESNPGNFDSCWKCGTPLNPLLEQ
jgi:uncharacterized paraquat-inducible protein A